MSKRVYVHTYVRTCVYRLAISIFYPVDSVNLESTMTATTKHVYCKHYLKRQKKTNIWVKLKIHMYGCGMRHADTAAICGCVTRLASGVIPYVVERNAFSSSFYYAARWEHCMIPFLVIFRVAYMILRGGSHFDDYKKPVNIFYFIEYSFHYLHP